MELLELLKTNERIFFSVLPKDKTEFLSFVKSQGCTWLNGSEIKETDSLNGHISIHKDLRIGNVPYFAWFHPQNENVLKLDFAEYKNGIIKESKDELISSTNIFKGELL